MSLTVGGFQKRIFFFLFLLSLVTGQAANAEPRTFGMMGGRPQTRTFIERALERMRIAGANPYREHVMHEMGESFRERFEELSRLSEKERRGETLNQEESTSLGRLRESFYTHREFVNRLFTTTGAGEPAEFTAAREAALRDMAHTLQLTSLVNRATSAINTAGVIPEAVRPRLRAMLEHAQAQLTETRAVEVDEATGTVGAHTLAIHQAAELFEIDLPRALSADGLRVIDPVTGAERTVRLPANSQARRELVELLTLAGNQNWGPEVFASIRDFMRGPNSEAMIRSLLNLSRERAAIEAEGTPRGAATEEMARRIFERFVERRLAEERTARGRTLTEREREETRERVRNLLASSLCQNCMLGIGISLDIAARALAAMFPGNRGLTCRAPTGGGTPRIGGSGGTTTIPHITAPTGGGGVPVQF